MYISSCSLVHIFLLYYSILYILYYTILQYTMYIYYTTVYYIYSTTSLTEGAILQYELPILCYTRLQYTVYTVLFEATSSEGAPPDSQTRACPDRANFFTNRLSQNAQNRSRQGGPCHGVKKRITQSKRGVNNQNPSAPLRLPLFPLRQPS